MRLLILSAFLLVLWLLLSGMFTPLQLGLGVLSSAAVTWLSWRLDLIHSDPPMTRSLARLPGYIAWLALEIIKSNLHTARLIIAPRGKLHRSVVRLIPSQQTSLGVAIYANSITLTPGTLTMDADDGVLEVHCLSREVARDLESGEMDDRVARLEGTR